MRVDRSAPLRPDLHADPLLGVPAKQAFPAMAALAVITEYMAGRPSWDRGQPYPVRSAELYEAAEREMAANLKRRGFPMCVDDDLMRRGVRHFMLFGTPVVLGEIDG